MKRDTDGNCIVEAGDLPHQSLLKDIGTLAHDEWLHTYRPDTFSRMGMAAPSLTAPSSYHATMPPNATQSAQSGVNGAHAANAAAAAAYFPSIESELFPGEGEGRGSMHIPYFGGRGVGPFCEKQRWSGSVVKM